MHRLSLIVFFLASYLLGLTQSPHGEQLKMDCAACHNTDGWEIPANHWNFTEELKKTISEVTGRDITTPDSSFNHYNTDFPLEGTHAIVDCRSCHSTLVFEEATTQCIDCHLDVHSMTVGNDCIRCHSTQNWLVDEIPEIHEQNGFPLIGSHSGLSCIDCHVSETNLKFDRIGNDCYSCHQMDFENTESPNHIDAGFSTQCLDCHSPETESWNTDVVDHSFFPLTLGHDIQDCKACHLTNNFSDASPDCISCHQDDFINTVNPDHQELNFDNDCRKCHTTDPGWTPAAFVDHDANFFPIYSGKHDGKWIDCIDCHKDPQNYASFTCTSCHQNPETDDDHIDVVGYTYEDNACLICHPTGDADLAFDHNSTNFPLTGSHIGVECLECHENGFEGTSTNCFDCHEMDFNSSLNPNHTVLNLPNDCASCHTTDPDWMPATFDIHDDFYPLIGAHSLIADNCATCHNGDYNNTPSTCVGCHLDDYSMTTNPDHAAVNFSQDCVNCHNQDAWDPSTFDHDAAFPIYTGTHEGEWAECIDCHTNPNNIQEFQCTNCHENPEMDDEHIDVPGYIYEDNACFACHPTGEADIVFDHNTTNFILEGGHLGVDCLSCHSGGFEGTSTNCFDCHQNDFNATVNPNHTDLNLPNDCASCHVTDPGWMPATFDIHNDFYVLEGAHATIAQDCATCHNGDYINTPNTCIGCHQMEYDNTTDPNHQDAQFGTDCMSCHNQTEWDPSTFDHDGENFPIYSGTHEGEWAQCIDCHSNPSNYADFQCINCHLNPEMDDEHDGIGGYLYENNACFACHPMGEAGMAFDHNNTTFPLENAHLGLDCIECHANGYQGTSTVCNDCHNEDYLASINPAHNNLGISTDCISCHTTEAGWAPATFDVHDDYYELTGAHISIANDCVTCHNGDYINTPNTCVGCHQMDYDASINPDHQSLNLPNDCASCHVTDPGWEPASFDIHNDFYVLEGAHALISNDCATCHNGDYVNTPNTCIGCHQMEYDNTTNPDHAAAMFPTDCAQCHSQSEWFPSIFDHDGEHFPIYSGNHEGVWSECIECHQNPNNFAEFQCINCHLNPEMDDEHDGVGGYTYENNACFACHPTGDATMAFDHNSTNFPLTGAHLTAECIDCHINGYPGTPTDCYACHSSDFDATTNPNHNTLNLPTDCASCHTTDAGWMPATFDIHDNYWTLTGAHIPIANDCAGCHNGDYNNTPTDCQGCHTPDYNLTTNPNHNTLNIPLDCASCHTTEAGWMPATFDIHDNYWTLTGAHIPIANDCAGCHNGDYNNTPTDCQGCHTPDYNQTTNPNHSNLNIPLDCASCHTTDAGWMPATFDIHDNYYPLTGAHLPIANDCAACHNGDYNNTPNTCAGCHTPDYNNATNPNHIVLAIPTSCDNCHTTDPDWMPATFDIHNNYYPLNGAHAIIANDCVVCHNGDYNNTPNTCIGCHQTDYDGTTNPDHNQANFSNDCLNCHTEIAWTPSSFDHNAIYPLNGAHALIASDCNACHSNGYVNTPNTCVGCHQIDYDNTTNPPHLSAGFPTDCISCHTEDAWVPSTFDHDSMFPIYSGKHEGEWGLCAECHTTPSDYSLFSCIDCHEHDDEAEVDDDHDGVPGYIYESNACYACHPTGED